MKIFIIATLLYSSLFGMSLGTSKKKLLKEVYYDHKITFYCKSPYILKTVKGKEKAIIIQDKTIYTPRNFYTKKGNINKRSKRIEWEHIVPAENFGRQLSCWRNGNSKCVTKKGKVYKGRRCCRKVSSIFRRMESDMYNLVPAIGEINADRSNYRFMDTKQIIKGQYGECKFKVNFKERKVYPANYTKGFISRTYLYFSKKYKIKLSKRERKIFQIWDKKYPKTEWESLREKRIKEVLK